MTRPSLATIVQSFSAERYAFKAQRKDGFSFTSA